MIEVRDLHKEHPAVLAAYAMVEAYEAHDTLLPAVEEVLNKFPDEDESHVAAMWLAINAAKNKK